MCLCCRGRERNSFRQEGKFSSCYFILNGKINFHQLNIWVFIKHVIYPRHRARNMKYHSEQFLQGVNRLCVHTKLLQLYLALCDPVDCSPPSSSVHEIFQARKLVWVTISSSRGSSQPGIEPTSPESAALAGRFFTTEPHGKPHFECIIFSKYFKL